LWECLIKLQKGNIVKLTIPIIFAMSLNSFADYQFEKNKNELVIKDATKGFSKEVIWKNNLIWQDEEYSEDEINTYKQNDKDYQKVGTLEYAKSYCKNSTYIGITTWRLPYFHELNTIRDKHNSINSKFRKVPEGFFWSLDEDLNDKTKYKRVSFKMNRADAYISQNHHLYIRCVTDEYNSEHFKKVK
jgi:hypothetical protein